jgi:hypothetical protein
MTPYAHLAHSLQLSLSMLTSATADLTDADLMVRPVPGANHANWQIGHLLSVENQLAGAVGASVPTLPAGFAERYAKPAAAHDDPAAFLPKATLISLLEQTHAAIIAWVNAATPEQMAAPAPAPVQRLAPTVIDMMTLFTSHLAMHLGQIQVLRRKLAKPVLF